MKRNSDVENLYLKVVEKTLCSIYDLRVRIIIFRRIYKALNGINNNVKCDFLNKILTDHFGGAK